VLLAFKLAYPLPLFTWFVRKWSRKSWRRIRHYPCHLKKAHLFFQRLAFSQGAQAPPAHRLETISSKSNLKSHLWIPTIKALVFKEKMLTEGNVNFGSVPNYRRNKSIKLSFPKQWRVFEEIPFGPVERLANTLERCIRYVGGNRMPRRHTVDQSRQCLLFEVPRADEQLSGGNNPIFLPKAQLTNLG